MAATDESARFADGVALSVPVTQAAITGVTQISGNFTEKSAEALVTQLSGGSMPVPLRVVSTTVLAGPGKLVGVDWRLDQIDGKSVDLPLTDARFMIDSKGRFSGSNGCNDLSGLVTIKSDTIKFGPLATTEADCAGSDPVIPAQVARVEALLTGTLQWTVQNEHLTLSRDGSAVLAYRAVPAPTTEPKAVISGERRLTTVTQDTTTSSTGSSVPPGAPLKFDGHGRFTASDSCNSGGGAVTITAGKMVISQYISTKMACPRVDPIQTHTVARVIDGTVTSSIKDGQLTLTKAGVGSLTYAQASALPATGSS